MKNLEAYKNQLKEIEALIDKLEKGELSLDELVTLEKLTGELHEKSIILKYKAFESHVHGETAEVDEPQPVQEEVIEEEPEEESPALEFAIFDDIADEEPEEAVVPEVEPEPVVEEPQAEVEPEPQVVEPKEIVPEEKPAPIVVELKDPEAEQEDPAPVVEEKAETNADLSFWEKINIEDNSLGSQFADAKLDSLVGAFGLNQKLRYINDLFDGSSEMFSDAIKILDTQADLAAARTKVGELASEHSWDPEEESVAEFMSFVNRRYA